MEYHKEVPVSEADFEGNFESHFLPQTKRNWKDSVFRMLMLDKENLLSVHNALFGTNYDNPDILEIVTLDNALYKTLKNDVAYRIENKLYLIEHQSTRSLNMPMRMNVYLCTEILALTDWNKIYLEHLLELPEPKCIVFYNGKKDTADYQVLHLSDEYQHFGTEPDWELKVHVYNINSGHNEWLMKACPVLHEYAQFVQCVRDLKERIRKKMEYKKLSNKEMDDLAVNEAVEYCIQNGILVDFLKKHRTEVITAAIYGFREDEYEAALKEVMYEEGHTEGHAAGHAEGLAEGLAEGRAEGRAEGHAKLLRETIVRMSQRGYSAEMIADVMDENLETVKNIIEASVS